MSKSIKSVIASVGLSVLIAASSYALPEFEIRWVESGTSLAAPMRNETAKTEAISNFDNQKSDEISDADQKSVILSGTLYPGKILTINAPFSGYVQAVYQSTPGASVKKSEKLLSLAAPELQKSIKKLRIESKEAERAYLKIKNWNSDPSVLRAKREIDAAKQALLKAKKAVAVDKSLFEDGIIAFNEYQSQEQSLQSAKDILQTAEEAYTEILKQGSDAQLELVRLKYEIALADLASAEVAFRKNIVTAPLNGIVLPITIQSSESKSGNQELTSGRKVLEGNPILAIGNLDTIEIRTQVSEIDVNKLSVGDVARISNPKDNGPSAALMGKVTSISNFATDFQIEGSNNNTGVRQSNVARYEVRVLAPAKHRSDRFRIRVGMNVNVEIFTGDEGSKLSHADKS